MSSRQPLTTQNADYQLDVYRRDRIMRRVERDRLARRVSDPPVRHFLFPSLTELLGRFAGQVRQGVGTLQRDLMMREHRWVERRHHHV
ncbi:MAG: hypothetical protein JNL42_18100 [Anaerolineae bacterium]|nr:hypothetical protein [Anaerolineae bacterium]